LKGYEEDVDARYAFLAEIRKIAQTRIRRHIRKFLYRRAAVFMPLPEAFRILQTHGIDVARAHVLDVFGGTGELSSFEFIPLVGHVEAWEFQRDRSERMKQLFPAVTTVVCDSFEKIREDGEKFDIVVVDTGGQPREAFDLFPHAFNRLKDDSGLVVNAFTDVSNPQLQICFAGQDLTERARFYNATNPLVIPIEHMVECYAQRARHAGLAVEHAEALHRYQNVYRLVLKLKRLGYKAKCGVALKPHR
jgi:hypothetical protein